MFEEEQKTANLKQQDKNEVVTFCDTGPLERRIADPLHYFDTKVGQAVGKTNGCEGGTFMYTQIFVDQWDLIQVRPWFLEYARS